VTLSPSTITLLDTLDALSRRRLSHREDLGILLDLGAPPERAAALNDLAFRAKFLTRTFGIMQRIGREGAGYDRLESEFAVNLDVVRGHMRTLLDGTPDDVRERFTASYLAMTPAGLSNLMALLGDLAWYKNWLLDSTQGHA
jgi:hypothetical protein